MAMFRLSQIAMCRMGLAVLTMSLGFFFILVGSLKISPTLNEGVYREMRKMFIRHARVFPFSDQTGWTPNPHTFRTITGVVELLCGIVISLIPGRMKECSAVILLLLMSFMVHNHIALGDGIERSSPTLAIILAITSRYFLALYVRWYDFTTSACCSFAASRTADVAPAGECKDGERDCVSKPASVAETTGGNEKKKAD